MIDGMQCVGLANIFEKKIINIDGKMRCFFKKIDSGYGFEYNFKNSGEKFIVLTGKLAGHEININVKNMDMDDDDSRYSIADFKTIEYLSTNNNRTYNYDLFIKNYQKNMGCYFTYDADRRQFILIDDNELLNKINATNKDYDPNILNGNTDISQMYTEIKKTIISQDEQIMQILTSLFKNQKVVNSKLSSDMISKLKENIIIYGSTGTGKTEILKRIANIYNVPIVIEDATALSETGYIGRNITDMLEDLYLASDNDIEKAEKGILVIDEFDKLAEKKNGSQDHVSRFGVQRSLLKLLDGTVFYFNNKKFDTSKLSVVALGAFTGINEYDDYFNVKSNDFVDYGIMRELMSRFSKLVVMNTLSKDDIKKILVESDFSPLNTYKLLFDSMNIEFNYDDDFIDYVASKAIEMHSGARSLKTVFDNIISEAMFRIFAGDYSKVELSRPNDASDKAYKLSRKKDK